jgi:hypothetical protein
MIIFNGNVCARVPASGKEDLLGRWSWVQLRGRNGLVLIIVTVYRPVLAEGSLTAYQQHNNKRTRFLD